MKLQSVQMLRGVAAYCVAMTHLVSFEREAIIENGFTEASLTGGLWHNGFAGVDLFFVISGFIMVYVTTGRERGARSAGDFLLARASRIYPLWWLFAALMAIIFINVHGVPYHPEEFGKTNHGELSYILKSIFLLPQAGLPVLGVGWTLIHEMYFYVVFAAFLLLPQRYLPSLLIFWGVFVILSYVGGLSSTAPDTILHLITYPMTIEFIMGAFVGLVLTKYPPRLCWGLAILGISAFTLGLIFFQNSDSETAGLWATLKWGRVICFGIPAALALYGLVGLELEEKMSFPRSIAFLGDISYALYLSHVLVFMTVKRVFSHISSVSSGPDSVPSLFAIGSSGPFDNLIFVVVCLGAATMVAAISYHWIEQPSLRILRQVRHSVFSPLDQQKAQRVRQN